MVVCTMQDAISGQLQPVLGRCAAGGISNGEHIVLRVAFKPTSTISREQRTVSRAGEDVSLRAKGRHDPCVVPRAVPMVEAMVALVLVDHLLMVSALRTVGNLPEEQPSTRDL